MQQHSARLRVLLEAEADGESDLSPAGEPAIRGHLRLVSEALAVTAGPATRGGLEQLALDLPNWFTERDGEIADQMARQAAAAEHELDRQFGTDRPTDDPSVQGMADRRMRVDGWLRLFLRWVGESIGDDGFASVAVAWMDDHQTDLANTIFAMDRRAKEAEIARTGETAVDDPVVVNRIGQAAMLQAHTRFLVEACAATFTARQR